MTDTEDDCSTPKLKVRRLGLGRTNSARLINTTPGLRLSVRDDLWTQTPPNAANERQKVATCNVETPCSSTLNYTPELKQSTPRPTAISSANCRPYRLSLSRRIRTELSKKRLEFHTANGTKPNNDLFNEVAGSVAISKRLAVNEKILNVPTLQRKAVTEMSNDEIIAEINHLEKQLSGKESQERRLLDLRGCIEVWKTAFAEAVAELQQSVQPQPNKQQLLSQLGISPEMLKYLEEFD